QSYQLAITTGEDDQLAAAKALVKRSRPATGSSSVLTVNAQDGSPVYAHNGSSRADSSSQQVQSLSREVILEVHAAACSCSLSRTTLLGGIPNEVTYGLPDAADKGSQLLSDLSELNRMGRLSDGSLPIAAWLENACALSRTRRENTVFTRALASLN